MLTQKLSQQLCAKLQWFYADVAQCLSQDSWLSFERQNSEEFEVSWILYCFWLCLTNFLAPHLDQYFSKGQNSESYYLLYFS